jgi:hypothetical protein
MMPGTVVLLRPGGGGGGTAGLHGGEGSSSFGELEDGRLWRGYR